MLDDLGMDDEEETNNSGGRGDEQDKDDVGLDDLDDGYWVLVVVDIAFYFSCFCAMFVIVDY